MPGEGAAVLGWCWLLDDSPAQLRRTAARRFLRVPLRADRMPWWSLQASMVLAVMCKGCGEVPGGCRGGESRCPGQRCCRTQSSAQYVAARPFLDGNNAQHLTSPWTRMVAGRCVPASAHPVAGHHAACVAGDLLVAGGVAWPLPTPWRPLPWRQGRWPRTRRPWSCSGGGPPRRARSRTGRLRRRRRRCPPGCSTTRRCCTCVRGTCRRRLRSCGRPCRCGSAWHRFYRY
jgi:hypothetical protein